MLIPIMGTPSHLRAMKNLSGAVNQTLSRGMVYKCKRKAVDRYSQDSGMHVFNGLQHMVPTSTLRSAFSSRDLNPVKLEVSKTPKPAWSRG